MWHRWKLERDAQLHQVLVLLSNSSWYHLHPATRIVVVSIKNWLCTHKNKLLEHIVCVLIRLGIALDGHLKDEDVNLASSTLISDGKTSTDAMGIVISYSVRVKVNCGTLGGELVTDVPFKLMHPAPGKLPRLLTFIFLSFSAISWFSFNSCSSKIRHCWAWTRQCYEENEINWKTSIRKQPLCWWRW